MNLFSNRMIGCYMVQFQPKNWLEVGKFFQSIDCAQSGPELNVVILRCPFELDSARRIPMLEDAPRRKETFFFRF